MRWIIVVWSLLNGIAGPMFLWSAVFPPDDLVDPDATVSGITFFGSVRFNLFLRGVFSSILLVFGILLAIRSRWTVVTGSIGYGFQIVRGLNVILFAGSGLYSHHVAVRALIACLIMIYVFSNRKEYGDVSRQ